MSDEEQLARESEDIRSNVMTFINNKGELFDSNISEEQKLTNDQT
jgi:hypothetical protein